MQRNEWTGRRFGRLLVLKRAPSKNGCTRWKVRCDCGTVKIVFATALNGDTLSCGCLGRERTKQRSTKHGLSSHPLYHVYNGMMDRCYNANNPAFKNYGARGIGVCREWRGKPQAFIRWIEANGYAQGLDLDRKNNDKGYSPSNCHFVTRKQSNRNYRRNVLVTAWGVTKCVADWVTDPRCSVSRQGLRKRLAAGWPPERAISSPSFR